ncbi:TonB-dependent receptor [Thermodesulforhabdus norvegica]|uniref:Outer membrane receptor proteins, mostly Fe transport n=1 Tax=Thermodesulforhabdus norvegica TaxID=39841 RepID=A0A1I4T6G8_9BACT|nr:TonB-dependent receptor [Thermodesulforhabdus norvegica]SFM72296.1 Outer membrane receptor proteins, mostly Fe transport [Thermodesulforhabdus norvegica]
MPEMVVEEEMLTKGSVSINNEALPASVYVITGAEIRDMPVQHYLDFFRRIPGVITSHYGQGDVADGFGMRGYQSGHGSQIAIYVDGVPINIPHHSHSHGLADLGWLIPEMIDRIEVIKGPFSVLYGNFALGGVVNIVTKKYQQDPEVAVEAGSFETYRAVATVSKDSWEITPLSVRPFLIYEIYDRDGFRDNSDYRRYNAFNKITFPVVGGLLSLQAHYVDRDWGAPGYLSVSDVKEELHSRTDAVNPEDGGNSEYKNLVLNFVPKTGEAGLYATLYVASHRMNRYATFEPSPQTLEHNDWDYGGWRLLYDFVPFKKLSVLVGSDGRYSEGDRLGYITENRDIVARTEDWHIENLGVGLFGQVQWKPVKFLKIVGGLRYDFFSFDIDNHVRPQNSGDGTTSIMSPKVGLVISPTKNFNLFANKGLGFRTPSADEMSPADRDYANFDLEPAKVDTWDIGFDAFLFDRLQLLFDFYRTDMEREIRWVGSETVNVGESRRDGYELEFTLHATPDLRFYINYGQVNARLKNPAVPGHDRVTGVPEDYLSAGIQWEIIVHDGARLFFDFAYQRLGEAPLDASGSVFRPPVGRYMGKASFRIKGWTFSLQVNYHPSKYASEAMFLLGGEPAYDPKPVYEFVVGVKYTF